MNTKALLAEMEGLRGIECDGRKLLDDCIALVKKHEVEVRPKIVCLCGSTRFFETWQEQNFKETMKGNIVLAVGFFSHASSKAHGQTVGITPEEKIALDELHKRKIDLSDEVLILNVGGYIGESTRSELDYAIAHKKAVRYLEPAERSCESCNYQEPAKPCGGIDIVCHNFSHYQPKQPTPKGELQAKDLLPLLHDITDLAFDASMNSAGWVVEKRNKIKKELAKLEGK
jgi:hypothetical protein